MSSSPYATLYASTSSCQPCSSTLAPIRSRSSTHSGRSSPPCWRTTCSARSTVIQHITLEKTWCRGGRRASQMPWSGSCQRRRTASTMFSRHPPLVVADRAAGVGDGRDQVGDRAEDVELELVVGEVADPDRPGAGVPGQGVDDRLGAQLVAVDGVERVQPLRVPAGALDAAVHPAQQRLGLLDGAEVDQRAGGHRRVAQPAVAVVPVADAAQLLGQRGGRRGQDRAGRPRGRARAG